MYIDSKHRHSQFRRLTIGDRQSTETWNLKAVVIASVVDAGQMDANRFRISAA